MTELEYIEIEGFKGLEYVEFEPTDINLITGRNNTGKTSFLEAVDLLFNPANLQTFAQNLDSVVHLGSDYSSIKGETAQSEFEITLEKPSFEETERYFTKAILEGLTYDLYADTRTGESREIQKEIREIARQTLNRDGGLSPEKLQKEMLILSTQEGYYPYLLGGEQSTHILMNILESIYERIDGKSEFESLFVTNEGTPVGHLNFESGEVQANFSPGRISSNQPNTKGCLSFIESADVGQNIEQTDDKKDPIKIDDIGDFIKEKELVDDLKTFTLDYLVFEDEEGNKEQIPFEFMGDGFKSIVGLLWELMNDEIEDDIVLLEEPENHMHPGYIREVVYFLIELAREEDVQLFITTHDSDFINDFFTENLTEQEESYLEEEFSLLRMEEDSAVVEDYETARENLKDLHLDLRGI